MAEILFEQEQQCASLKKALSKPLELIQIEERAIAQLKQREHERWSDDVKITVAVVPHIGRAQPIWRATADGRAHPSH